MPKSPNAALNHENGRRRIFEKQQRDAFQRGLATLSREYLDKLRYDCLRAANTQSLTTGASPDEVVRQAEKDFRARVAFLITGGAS
jgi:hypothetical protein